MVRNHKPKFVSLQFFRVFLSTGKMHCSQTSITFNRSGNNITLGSGTSQVFENQLITATSEDMNSNNFVGLTVDSNVGVEGYWRFLRSNGKYLSLEFYQHEYPTTLILPFRTRNSFHYFVNYEKKLFIYFFFFQLDNCSTDISTMKMNLTGTICGTPKMNSITLFFQSKDVKMPKLVCFDVIKC